MASCPVISWPLRASACLAGWRFWTSWTPPPITQHFTRLAAVPTPFHRLLCRVELFFLDTSPFIQRYYNLSIVDQNEQEGGANDYSDISWRECRGKRWCHAWVSHLLLSPSATCASPAACAPAPASVGAANGIGVGRCMAWSRFRVASYATTSTHPSDTEPSAAPYAGGLLEQSWEAQLLELERHLNASTAEWKVGGAGAGSRLVAAAGAGAPLECIRLKAPAAEWKA